MFNTMKTPITVLSTLFELSVAIFVYPSNKLRSVSAIN